MSNSVVAYKVTDEFNMSDLISKIRPDNRNKLNSVLSTSTTFVIRKYLFGLFYDTLSKGGYTSPIPHLHPTHLP